ncbi:MAG: hypothetical protein CFH19_01234 [Alphaproteobacteria bacterium MarineAlpha5_Bin9]|nr:MAG: hypothetical protein CFH19_01234 [Alphaproteobacteria bacterium MarineAlpha5_Bin9]
MKFPLKEIIIFLILTIIIIIAVQIFAVIISIE